MRGEELQKVLEKYWYTDENLDKKTIMAEVEAYLDDMEKRQECFTLNLATLREDIAEYIFNEYFLDYLPSTPLNLDDLRNIKNGLKSLYSYKEATGLLREAILETAKKEGILRDRDNSRKSKDEFDF